MMRNSSFVASDVQQSPTFAAGDKTTDDVSISGSDDEDLNGDTPVSGTKKRKRSHVKISYVVFLALLYILCHL